MSAPKTFRIKESESDIRKLMKSSNAMIGWDAITQHREGVTRDREAFHNYFLSKFANLAHFDYAHGDKVQIPLILSS